MKDLEGNGILRNIEQLISESAQSIRYEHHRRLSMEDEDGLVAIRMPLVAWRQWCEWLRRSIVPEVTLDQKSKEEIIRAETEF